MYDYTQIIDKYYPAGSELRQIYERHCRSVAVEAIAIERRLHLPLDEADVEAAAMLHDIGICLTDALGIHCHGTHPYLAHGCLGADLLRREGAPEIYALVAERHTGAGLTPEDVEARNARFAAQGSDSGHRYAQALDLSRCYMPQSLLERLISYADKFYSKSGDMQRKPLDRVRASLAKFGAAALARFDALHAEFGNEGI